ncbi:MAG TPA: GNAT family N-acetyltransferase [Bdellovibrionales bacterium]|nr:GNAT family N-acetyltransferase [Bdellovibrionales bacterium]
MTIPIFETKRLIMRAPTLEDAPSYLKNFNDWEVIRYLSDAVPWPYPDTGIVDFLENIVFPTQGTDRWLWGLFLKSAPKEMIGGVDLWRMKEGTPENRGFWLARKLWGQGLMPEAVVPVTDFAFNELGFEKLIFSNVLGNVASRRVKEKTGARFTGTAPVRAVDPVFTERELWELTKKDWQHFRSGSET